MEKKGSTRSWIIISIVVVALIIIGFLIYFLVARNSTAPSTSVINAHCKLASSAKSIELSTGISTGVPLTGYQGTLDQVSWASADSNIAAVNPVSGPDAMIQAKNIGTTTVTATDNAVSSSCTVSIQVTVTA